MAVRDDPIKQQAKIIKLLNVLKNLLHYNAMEIFNNELIKN